jgi:hypothetical protein
MKKKIFPSLPFWGIVLLAVLFFSIFILPALSLDWQLWLSKITYTLIFLSAIFSMKKKVKPILIFFVLAIIMDWVSGIFSLWILNTVSRALNVLFFIIIVMFLIRQVATSPQVNLRVILGSVIGYLLLGLTYSIFVAFIMQQDPGAFNITRSVPEIAKPVEHFSESIYFSFVTLATLGYGDILPVKPYARSLAIFITVSGQLYVAVIIALLVGKFSSGDSVKKE